VRVENNELLNWSSGVGIKQASGTRAVIIGNHLDNCKTGILLPSGADNCIILGNKFDGANVGAGAGVDCTANRCIIMEIGLKVLELV
jgi:hypothetical protein